LNRNPSHVKEALRIRCKEEFCVSFTLEFTEGTRAPNENYRRSMASVLSQTSISRAETCREEILRACDKKENLN